MNSTTQFSITRSIFTLLAATLICVASVTEIKLSSTQSFSLLNFVSILVALVAGGAQGAGSAGLFLLLGVVGIPVFYNNQSGFAPLRGADGLFIAGVFFASLVAGLVAGTPYKQETKFSATRWLRTAIATLAGFIFFYAPGIPRYIVCKEALGQVLTVKDVFYAKIFPYISTDIIKFIALVPIASVLRPFVAKILYPDDKKEMEERMASLSKQKHKF